MPSGHEEVGNWRAARSFEDVLELGRRYVRGEIDNFPGWGSDTLDEESDDIEALLLAANGLGMLTVASQPGRPFSPGHDDWNWAGRAFVGGWMPEASVAAVAHWAQATGLLALVETAKGNARLSFPSTPVGLRDGVPYLVLAPGAREQELEIFKDALDEAAFSEVQRCALLWVIDPVWGRRQRLPAAFEAAYQAADDVSSDASNTGRNAP